MEDEPVKWRGQLQRPVAQSLGLFLQVVCFATLSVEQS